MLFGHGQKAIAQQPKRGLRTSIIDPENKYASKLSNSRPKEQPESKIRYFVFDQSPQFKRPLTPFEQLQLEFDNGPSMRKEVLATYTYLLQQPQANNREKGPYLHHKLGILIMPLEKEFTCAISGKNNPGVILYEMPYSSSHTFHEDIIRQFSSAEYQDAISKTPLDS